MEPCCLSPNTCQKGFWSRQDRVHWVAHNKGRFCAGHVLLLLLARDVNWWVFAVHSTRCKKPHCPFRRKPCFCLQFSFTFTNLVGGFWFSFFFFFFLMHWNFTVLLSDNYSIFCFPPLSLGFLHSSGWAAGMLEQLPGKFSDIQKQHRRNYYGFWVLRSTVFSTAWSCCSAMFFWDDLF